MITIKEVSELAQVSQSTVSRALNGHPTVKEANRAKVFAAIEKLGYKPNAFAQALASSRSNSIGMLVGSLDGPFYGPLMHMTEDTVRQKNLHLIVTSGQESHDKEADSIRFLQSRQVDGLIIHSDKLSDDELIKIAQQTESTIILNRYIPELAEKCICIDNELGGYLATKHLLENGHTTVACITGQMSKIDSRDRLQGYRNALAEYGIQYDTNLIVEGRFDHDGNHEAVRRLLDRNENITAIFCQNDNIALAVYDVCSERGITIGKELSVVGFDNDTYSQHIRPRLTTVNFPVREMGVEAANGVLSLLNQDKQSLRNKLTPELIIRDSVSKLGE
ncbi:LacI family DNA-binding transcriptional regulator [Photobacterium gaetbulicola]|uniref:Transcriptional regulator n=1 Tax=Photobacterium gaetbulicola Gung47 TaxID=658445 RepID=A0A0C5WT97_9GAMM|nr:LacI family DNA-binding transcriptional regulator [Photobacterium gaetbulicola]AJR06230.1 transcriptional regulator [Photobacterium gaetbulicola Gung47]PSU08821.1 LacI family DNA-binding transcriptional regulator [Photobacterium gaetbulicola]